MKDEYSFKDGSLVYFFSIVGLFVASVVLTMIANIVIGATGQSATDLVNQNWVTYLNAIFNELAFLLVFIIYSKDSRTKKYSIKNINKSTFDLRLLVVFGLALVVFFGSLNFTTFFNTLFAKISTPSNSNVPLANFGEFLLSVLCFAVAPAIAEELVFRGVIFSSLKNKIGTVFAIFVSSIIFTLIHFSIFQTIHQFILGVVLSLIFYVTGKLVYSMFFHFFNNFFVLFFVYVTKNSNFAIFSNFGTLEIILTFVIFVVAVLLSVFGFYFLKKLANKKKEENTQNQGNNKNNTIIATDNRFDALYIGLYILVFVFCIIYWFANSFVK